MHLQITPHIDVALIALNAFFLFFLGLVIYLRREDRREGYPLEDELTGRLESAGGPILTASPKTFRLSFDRGSVTAPTKGREPVEVAGARRTDRFHGASIEPTGNPLVDGVGPAAWADRAKRPDIDWEGRPRIVPISTDDGFFIAKGDADPRGFAVVGADGKVAGKVVDLWVDRADRLIRYLDVELSVGKRVLAPMAMATIQGEYHRVSLDAITAAQFADVPAIAGPDTITFYEEERIVAYFGGGYLYATPDRAEPLL
ncbi:photosynthetic reaction center subunit H [Sphingomonas sp. GlSt437]|uniref:photosynthetic reaction center subunit H n=1 Tax=Sphingomonas sp. GlSt437 TaxID=3389970 RepID=UPI003A880F16